MFMEILQTHLMRATMETKNLFLEGFDEELEGLGRLRIHHVETRRIEGHKRCHKILRPERKTCRGTGTTKNKRTGADEDYIIIL